MLDPNIILRGQQAADPFDSAAKGIQFGQGLRQLLSGRQAGKMAQLETPEEQQAFANKSMFGRELNAQIKSEALAKQKQMYEQLKTKAEIGKISSESAKNNAQAGGYSLDNSQKLMGAADKALMYAAQTGDPMAAKLALNNALKAGAVTPELFEQYNTQIDVLGTNPEALKQFAGGIVFANAKDPASLLYADANTVANNAQSDANSKRTYDASIYGTSVGASTADKNRTQSDTHFQQQQYFQQHKPQQFITGADGFQYAIFPDGSGMRVVGQDGQPIKAAASGKNSAETPIKRMERQEKIQNFATASRGAANAAQQAADLANDLKGLNKTAGGWGIMAKVPGTDARNFATKIETLKSQVFLNQVEKMRGLGALTDFEGKKLETAIASLDINLEPKQLQDNLTVISQIMSEAAKNANKKAQIYAGDHGQQAAPAQANGKVFTQNMIREYAAQSGRSADEIAQMVRQSGGTIQ